MYMGKVNIGEINMEFVRRALSQDVTVSDSKVNCFVPSEHRRLNVGKCSLSRTRYILDINLIIQEQELAGIKGTMLEPKLLLNTENVLVDEDTYYLRIDGLLIYIGNSSQTAMHLEIPAACTERSFKAKKRRDKNR